MTKTEADQLIKQLKEYQKEVTVSKETALATLVRAGLITKDGNPTPHYAPEKGSDPAGLGARLENV